MVTHNRHLPCPPAGDNPCGCGAKYCGKMTYIQPPMRESCKPESQYRVPTHPIDSNTVYKHSYFGSGPKEMKMCRMKPFVPINSIQSSTKEIDPNTITSLSFRGHTEFCKRKPILPHARTMLGTGPMQNYTTQKHDYVAKPTCKRDLIVPLGKIQRSDTPLDDNTVQKLSFLPPDFTNFSMPTSFRPKNEYKRSDAPMESNTTQKLSYMPVQPSVKEEFPWAKNNRIPLSDEPFEQYTTYKLSYIPNSADHKPKPVKAMDNQNLLTSSTDFDDHTVYKQSYFEPGGYFKRHPIKPEVLLHGSDAKIDPNTVYNLSYPGHSDVEKRSAILPHARFLLERGPLDDMTTQKHDYVSKPWCRRNLIVPPTRIEKLQAPFANETTAKLSYMEPGGFDKAISYKPKDGVIQSEAPMDDKTIQKLSYAPVTPAPKEEYPWAMKKVHNSNQPMDFNTTQCLSFLPPGHYIKGDGCNCTHPGECFSDKYPKADCYDVCTR